MTNTATAVLAGADARPTRRAGRSAGRRATPRGVPRWLWLLGVTVQPLGPVEADGTRAWVVSAGAGASGMAALFFATVEQDPAEPTREDPS